MASARGDRDPLALAAGQLAGIALEQLLDVHELGGAVDAAVDLGLRELGHPQAEGDVLEHREVREDRVVLEHHGDAALARRQVVDPPAADPDLALARRLEPGDDAQERGLAAARGAEQHHELLVGDGQVDRMQRGEGAEAAWRRS